MNELLYDPTDALLLRAALLQDGSALHAWNEWSAQIDLDRRWGQEAGIFPLAYQNLSKLDEPVQKLESLKKRYITTWFQNKIMFRRAAEALSLLSSIDVDVILLKGLAMSVAYYGDAGVRPMGDVDLLIDPDNVRKATEALEAAGFRVTPDPTPEIIRYFHSTHLETDDGYTIDLHWRPVWEFGPMMSVGRFWDNADRCVLHDAEAAVLTPSDQLFFTCIHAARSPEAPIRYLADAGYLVTHHLNLIDFGQLIESALTYQMVLPIRRTLSALDSLVGHVPQEPLRALREVELSQTERIQQRFEGSNRLRKVFGKTPKMLIRFLRLTEGEGVLRKLLGIPSFLAHSWNLDHGVKVPHTALVKLAKRTRRLVSSNRKDRD